MMDTQGREQVALTAIQDVLTTHHCILVVEPQPNQQITLPVGSIVVGTRYVVAVRALPEPPPTPSPPWEFNDPNAPQTVPLSTQEASDDAAMG